MKKWGWLKRYRYKYHVVIIIPTFADNISLGNIKRPASKNKHCISLIIHHFQSHSPTYHHRRLKCLRNQNALHQMGKPGMAGGNLSLNLIQVYDEQAPAPSSHSLGHWLPAASWLASHALGSQESRHGSWSQESEAHGGKRRNHHGRGSWRSRLCLHGPH